MEFYKATQPLFHEGEYRERGAVFPALTQHVDSKPAKASEAEFALEQAETLAEIEMKLSLGQNETVPVGGDRVYYSARGEIPPAMTIGGEPVLTGADDLV